jgi:hypothetical protein
MLRIEEKVRIRVLTRVRAGRHLAVELRERRLDIIQVGWRHWCV